METSRRILKSMLSLMKRKHKVQSPKSADEYTNIYIQPLYGGGTAEMTEGSVTSTVWCVSVVSAIPTTELPRLPPVPSSVL